MKILFTGGGTGGHLFPIIAIVRELRRLNTDSNFSVDYIGPNDKNNLFQLEQENINIHTIAAGKLRRYFSLSNVIDICFVIPFSIIQSFFLLLAIRPQLVFSKGGTASVPVTLSAAVLGIPIFLHESDVVGGLSNQVSGKWARKIFTSFEKTEGFDLARTIPVGTPIKKELLEGSSVSAKELFDLSLTKPVLMVWGGSQGAEAINDLVLSTANELLQRYEILHLCGKTHYKDMQSQTPYVIAKELQKNYHLYDAFNEVQLKHAYAAADLMVSRSGSASIFEMAALGKPSILIPLPGAAGDHQSKNAYQYAKTGAAMIIDQGNLTPHFFISKVDFILSQPEKMEQMRQAALAFARPLAAKSIAREILEYLNVT